MMGLDFIVKALTGKTTSEAIYGQYRASTSNSQAAKKSAAQSNTSTAAAPAVNSAAAGSPAPTDSASANQNRPNTMSAAAASPSADRKQAGDKPHTNSSTNSRFGTAAAEAMNAIQSYTVPVAGAAPATSSNPSTPSSRSRASSNSSNSVPVDSKKELDRAVAAAVAAQMQTIREQFEAERASMLKAQENALAAERATFDAERKQKQIEIEAAKAAAAAALASEAKLKEERDREQKATEAKLAEERKQMKEQQVAADAKLKKLADDQEKLSAELNRQKQKVEEQRKEAEARQKEDEAAATAALEKRIAAAAQQQKQRLLQEKATADARAKESADPKVMAEVVKENSERDSLIEALDEIIERTKMQLSAKPKYTKGADADYDELMKFAKDATFDEIMGVVGNFSKGFVPVLTPLLLSAEKIKNPLNLPPLVEIAATADPKVSEEELRDVEFRAQVHHVDPKTGLEQRMVQVLTYARNSAAAAGSGKDLKQSADAKSVQDKSYELSLNMPHKSKSIVTYFTISQEHGYQISRIRESSQSAAKANQSKENGAFYTAKKGRKIQYHAVPL